MPPARWPPGACPDRDGDGVPDREDKCPSAAGIEAMRGCPDADRDGLTDAKDRCPTLPGRRSMGGCPDADGDRIADPDDECPREPGPAATKGCPDGDGDGIVDSRDECPGQAGPSRFRGCPDRDGDGLPDDADRCPDLAGNLVTGCPDEDDDGFNDGEDDCPGLAGPLNGCPDTDGDQTADKDDACPRKPGPAVNNGCPAGPDAPLAGMASERLADIANTLRFEPGSTRLTEQSLLDLDEAVEILNRFPGYHLSINGYASGGASEIEDIRQARGIAYACAAALKKAGAEGARLEPEGYGGVRPGQDAEASAGGVNRRVEFRLVAGDE